MKLLKTIQELQNELSKNTELKRSLGFVPTMGALHTGHIRLVERCVRENGICVVSIFVNPTQFNDKKDLQAYPRDLEGDCRLLEKAGCHYVFAPEINEMYPEQDTRIFDFGDLGSVMEGRFRPGHFNGVAQIVSKLFDAVRPDKAYFGEKDFQQLAIIRKMVKLLGLKVEIVPCPIVRESDGLAMSSRNMRLNSGQRSEAVRISKTLAESLAMVPRTSVEDLKRWVVEKVDQSVELKTEYFDIVDGETLQSLENWDDSEYVVGCIAVFCGEIRLIDNVCYKNKIR